VLTGFTARGGDRGGDDDGDVLLPTPTLEPRAGDTAAADALGTTLVLLLLLLLLHALPALLSLATPRLRARI
jgi:hypothetical protein